MAPYFLLKCKSYMWRFIEPELRFLTETNFPKLRVLHVSRCSELEEIPCDIGDIPTLQTISVRECRASVVSSAQQIQKVQQDDFSNSEAEHICTGIEGTQDLQMVNLTLRVLSLPEVNRLPVIFQTIGLEYDEEVLPSIGNEVLKAVVAQFNTDQLLTERPHVSALVRESLIRRAKDFNIVLDDVAITHLSYGAEFSKAVEQKQVAQQEAERSKFVVMKADQERSAAIIRAEGESESAKLISDATAAAGMGLIELRKIEAAKENAASMARIGNVVYLPSSNNMLLGVNPAR
ncbi:prohibitin-3, mitochondrial-like [Salvia hispanica]|uniref:prohibitin-3, mitochondrial-like n=1 Tax=Salvia hispanica TaxID=49212 RepID=UPI00200947FD|nr:prohibitin-3, mitochondrial-like [Salvia hispanica]